MEKENADGLGSLLLLLLAIIALTFCLELSSTEDTTAAKPAGQEELLLLQLPDQLSKVSVKTAPAHHPIL